MHSKTVGITHIIIGYITYYIYYIANAKVAIIIHNE